MPEALIAALDELTAAHAAASATRRSWPSSTGCSRTYAGRPTPLTDARRLSEHAGGARILLKREDLAHTGSHKINNVLGQALLTQRMGKQRVIAETGAGQHGVATATACALFGLECTVYMGEEDTRRQALNVARMRLLGAEVVPVSSGTRTLKDAINEAMRDWVTNVDDTHYIIGSVVGPHPFPAMVRDFQRVIGVEARQQCLDLVGRLPDAVVACVGGGSNAMGLFHAFLHDTVGRAGRLRGGRRRRRDRPARRAADRRQPRRAARRAQLPHAGRRGPDARHARRISAGLDYPGVGPEHSWLRDTGRATYTGITDAWAMQALEKLAKSEGILCAIETAHAFAGACDWGRAQVAAGRDARDLVIVVNTSGAATRTSTPPPAGSAW